LNDLIDTERSYVDQLTGVIRVCSFPAYILPFLTYFQKIAAAWSRSNLPPPELDSMFRSIEGVYKANRSLLVVSRSVFIVHYSHLHRLQKLKEIGTNPSSPKALGDLLMRWVSP